MKKWKMQMVNQMSESKLGYDFRSMRIGNYQFLMNTDISVYPYFSIAVRQRVRKRMACNTVITSEARIGKSYMATDICRVIDRRFNVDDVVFRFSEFMRCAMTRHMGIPITFDEPSYALSKRDWYNEIQQALVKTIESFGFKVHPLFIPVINKALLDKTVRNYLLQYHVVMRDRGYGVVYRIFPSQFQDKVYPYEMCQIRYKLFDNNICDKLTCLDCKKLNPDEKDKRCMIFRAQYERKKAVTQEERYKSSAEEAEDKESQNISTDELEAKAMTLFDKFFNKDKERIDIQKLQLVLRKEFKIRVGHNKAYELKNLIMYDYPERFPKEVDDSNKTKKLKDVEKPDDTQ